MRKFFKILIFLLLLFVVSPVAAQTNKADKCSAITTGKNNTTSIFCGNVSINFPQLNLRRNSGIVLESIQLHKEHRKLWYDAKDRATGFWELSENEISDDQVSQICTDDLQLLARVTRQENCDRADKIFIWDDLGGAPTIALDVIVSSYAARNTIVNGLIVEIEYAELFIVPYGDKFGTRIPVIDTYEVDLSELFVEGTEEVSCVDSRQLPDGISISNRQGRCYPRYKEKHCELVEDLFLDYHSSCFNWQMMETQTFRMRTEEPVLIQTNAVYRFLLGFRNISGRGYLTNISLDTNKGTIDLGKVYLVTP